MKGNKFRAADHKPVRYTEVTKIVQCACGWTGSTPDEWLTHFEGEMKKSKEPPKRRLKAFMVGFGSVLDIAGTRSS